MSCLTHAAIPQYSLSAELAVMPACSLEWTYMTLPHSMMMNPVVLRRLMRSSPQQESTNAMSVGQSLLRVNSNPLCAVCLRNRQILMRSFQFLGPAQDVNLAHMPTIFLMSGRE